MSMNTSKKEDKDNGLLAKTSLLSADYFLDKGKTILQERGKTYDADDNQKERSMAKVVEAFYAITGILMSEKEGWQFMATLKQVRAFQKPDFHEDSWQDSINYLALAAEASSMRRNSLPPAPFVVPKPSGILEGKIREAMEALDSRITSNYKLFHSAISYLHYASVTKMNKEAWETLSDYEKAKWFFPDYS